MMQQMKQNKCMSCTFVLSILWNAQIQNYGWKLVFPRSGTSDNFCLHIAQVECAASSYIAIIVHKDSWNYILVQVWEAKFGKPRIAFIKWTALLKTGSVPLCCTTWCRRHRTQLGTGAIVVNLRLHSRVQTINYSLDGFCVITFLSGVNCLLATYSFWHLYTRSRKHVLSFT
jgi:hypothetical protein